MFTLKEQKSGIAIKLEVVMNEYITLKMFFLNIESFLFPDFFVFCMTSTASLYAMTLFLTRNDKCSWLFKKFHAYQQKSNE